VGVSVSVGGRGSKREQRGGFESEQAATEALERVLEQLRREQGLVESPTLAELVDIYLAQHEAEPETTEKLAGYSRRRCSSSASGVSPNSVRPQRRYTEKRPFESWEQLYTRTGTLPPRYRPMVLFAAATGLRPGEWLALEHRDIDRQAQVVYVRRTLRNGRVKPPNTKASVRAAAGSRPRTPPTSRRRAASTICGTPSRPSRSAPASPRSTSPATWEQAWP
jgi:integrase